MPKTVPIQNFHLNLNKFSTQIIRTLLCFVNEITESIYIHFGLAMHICHTTVD